MYWVTLVARFFFFLVFVFIAANFLSYGRKFNIFVAVLNFDRDSFFLLDAQMNEIRKNLITSLELADKYLIRLRT